MCHLPTFAQRAIAITLFVLVLGIASYLSTAAQTPRPGLPVRILVLAIDFDESRNEYSVEISISGPEYLRRLVMTVEEEESTKRVPQASGELSVDGRSTLRIPIPGAPLRDQTTYVIKFRGEDHYGELVQRQSEFGTDDDLTILGTGKFKHETPGLANIQVDVDSVRPEYDRAQLVIDLKISDQDLARVREYHVSIKDVEAGSNIFDRGFALLGGEILPRSLVIDLPAPMAQATTQREYTAFITLKTADGQSASNPEPYPFKPQPPPQPSSMENLGRALSTPTVLFSIVGIVLAVAAWFVVQQWQKMKEAALPPRPPMGSGTESYTAKRQAGRRDSHNGIQAGVRLRVLQTADPSDGVNRTLTRFPCTIGREGCDVNFPHDAHISRKHAEIDLHNGAVVLIDFGSRNGTYVDNEPLTPDLPRPLTGPTTIRLGTSTVIKLEPL